MRTVFTLLLFIVYFSANSQEVNNKDTILLMNGKTIPCTLLETDDFVTEYLYAKKNGKVKSSYADNLNIFELQRHNQKDTVIYFQDTLLGRDYSISEMRHYAYGAKDARNNYKTHWYFVGGAALGFTSVFLDTYRFPGEAANNGVSPGPFKTSPSVFPVVVPFAYTLSVGLPKTRLKKKHVTYYDLKDDEFYQRGFEKIARQKRIFSALESTLSGMALGYLLYFILRP